VAQVADGPCNWSLNTGCCSDWDSFEPATQEIAYSLATLTLWAATGRRFGRCEITVQPCRQRKQLPLYQAFPVPAFGFGAGNSDGYLMPFSPYILDGTWYNGCWGGCSCRASCEIALDGPTTTSGIVSVYVNGELVDPAAYRCRITTYSYVPMATAGRRVTTAINATAFEVTYLRGDEEPSALQIAGGILACEFASVHRRRRMPPAVTPSSAVTAGRQCHRDRSDYLDLGMTDIPEVDRVIVALNPVRQQERSRVYSPDRPRPRMVT
jgi:hypothetical protein